MAKKYSELTDREKVIYEIYSALDGISTYVQCMTGGDGTSHIIHRIKDCLNELELSKPYVEE